MTTNTFVGSALPMTMTVARRHQPKVLRVLGEAATGLPFEDRVLVWLGPHWDDEVSAFHHGSGGRIDTVLDAHKLGRVDEIYQTSITSRLKPETGHGEVAMAPVYTLKTHTDGGRQWVEVLKDGGPIHGYDRHFQFGFRKAMLILDAMPAIDTFVVDPSSRVGKSERTLHGVETGRLLRVSISPEFPKRHFVVLEPLMTLRDLNDQWVKINFGMEKAKALLALRDELRDWASHYGVSRPTRIWL